MGSLALKAGATALTFLATLSAAAQVSTHVKNAAAPLHPAVLSAPATPVIGGGLLRLSPSVRAANVEAVTSTYAS